MIPSRPFGRTTAGRLVKVANRIRGLHEQFGTRSYRVWLVWIEWPGGQRGSGEPGVLKELELLPVPRIPEEAVVRRRYSSGGAERDGDLTLDQIALPEPGTETATDAVTAELLRGEAPFEGGRIPPGVEFLYELRPTTPGATTMRFTLASEPKRDHGRLQWVVHLRHRNPDSRQDGRTAEATW